MDKVHKPITTQYYTPSTKPFRIYLLEMLEVFCLCVAVKFSVAPTNSSSLLLPIVNTPRTAPGTPTVRQDHLPVCHQYVLFFSGEEPRSRRYGRTAAMRLIVQPYDEDDDDDYFWSFS
jgi:hypothetical protein